MPGTILALYRNESISMFREEPKGATLQHKNGWVAAPEKEKGGDDSMEKERNTREQNLPEPYQPIMDGSMKVIMDEHGQAWLCDQDVDPEKNLMEQGAWLCRGVFFKKEH